ncbi:hypothetical protein OIV83_001554 [Microbotryomycetes sp. JL201]|nr:hypothetical protein OIV83_001554 [Microbotryomycetes sp. JL201]
MSVLKYVLMRVGPSSKGSQSCDGNAVEAYNLVQACAACQASPRRMQQAMPWADFTTNCPRRSNAQKWIARQDVSMSLPLWAYEDNSAQPMNVFLAFQQVLEHMSPNRTSFMAQSTATVTVFQAAALFTSQPASASASGTMKVGPPPTFVIVLAGKSSALLMMLDSN